jgi:hypothetical protein
MAGELVLTAKSVLRCAHMGVVDIEPSQEWVRVEDVPLLIEPDPKDRPIHRCPQATPTTPPCTRTVAVNEGTSYSAFVRIDDHRVCLGSTTGLTNWSKLAIIPFAVSSPEQDLVSMERG